MLGELFVLLRAACPAELKVLLAPFDVALAVDTVVQPDIVVARRSDLTPRDLPAAPVLAVEVLSPSTRRVDMTLKKSHFEAAGCASYWVVDPGEPRITAWDLVVGAYVEAGSAGGEETFAALRGAGHRHGDSPGFGDAGDHPPECRVCLPDADHQGRP